MQPLAALNNVQKAKLLHALFYTEMPAFLKFTAEVCQQMEDSQQWREGWTNQIVTPEFWANLGADTQRRIKRYGRELERSSNAFADQLFDGYGAIFLSHCLNQYVDVNQHSDPKFKTAVALFFNP